jgi:hypothetical protein
MAGDVKIQHPKAGQTVHAFSFVAYGKGRKSTEVKGRLLKHGGGQVEGTVLPKSKKFWAIQFTVSSGGTYDLQVRDANTDQLLAEAKDVKVQGTFGVNIDYPKAAEDFPVDTDFITYGRTDLNKVHTATLSVGSPTVTELYGPPTNPGSWSYEINGAPEGTENLTVAPTDGSDVGQTVSIQVQHM